jgi:uncharacterized protein (DUF736 family)
MSELVPLGGLWKQRSRSGKVYYSGRLNDTTRLVLFKNDSKDKDSQPDLRLYLRAVQTSDEGKGAERFADGVVDELVGE